MLRVSEIFASLQGEGYYLGVPSVFVRLFGCNFTCAGFSRRGPTSVVTDSIEIHAKDSGEWNNQVDPSILTSIKQVDGDSFSLGCDSRYSWDPAYKHLTQDYSPGDLALAIRDAARPTQIRHVVFTGGEPLLHQAQIAQVLELLPDGVIDVVTFETNASIIIAPRVADTLVGWVNADHRRHILFSNSPKLTHSGEPEARRINPLAMQAQARLRDTAGAGCVIQTCKYVVHARDQDFEEARSIHTRLVSWVTGMDWPTITAQVPAYAMPLGATVEQYHARMRDVAAMAFQWGFRYSPRAHLDLYGNKVGT